MTDDPNCEEAKQRLSMTLARGPGLVVSAFLNIKRKGQTNDRD